MTKRKIRENIYIMLFQTVFHQEAEWMDQAELFLEDLDGGNASEQEKKHLLERFEQVFSHLQELDEIIAANAKGWKLERLAKADLAILRLAVFEILYDEDVPDAVAINEAVELAKKYGQDNSFKFVNGILSTIEKNKVKEKNPPKEDTPEK